ncbi:metallophosphoesterase [Pandoraea sp. XJJ-1]|uniref:metallophosphoesterase family protein n=1 Tax=Pandoraea sp. XJJ-1 TaxID=3002643 RepID=UPI00227E949E|nr:metallophosphoesterase [Pandoraea sp. XJJ-1]WAL82925.1 metallophosphoesterase [Pandoraea sp. XJJ-1]
MKLAETHNSAPGTMTNNHFSWLHLSDLHFGQDAHTRLWPNFKSLFLDDLRHLTRLAGGVDLVVFSGDLTQRGTEAEYAALTNEIKDVFNVLGETGKTPALFVVPGNHDLARPPKDDPRTQMMRYFLHEADLMHSFWERSEDQYRALVREAFRAFEKWKETLPSEGIPLLDCKDGLLPGDASARMECNGLSIGLIGLNSAFLQLGEGDYKGKLCLDVRQINALTAGAPQPWCDRNNLNFLITHHPHDWLSKDSIAHFNSEIYPSGRFTAHMYGHMHDANSVTILHSGSHGRSFVQSASLFGMEHLSDGTTDRQHGFVLNRIEVSGNRANWMGWPRRATIHRKTLDRKIVPDHENFNLVPGHEHYVNQHIIAALNSTDRFELDAPVAVDIANAVKESASEDFEVLSTFQHILGEQDQHLGIRLLEQQACKEGIRRDKAAWVCSDWGLGRDGFLWSICKGTGRDAHPVYRIDCGSYAERSAFLDAFSTRAGCSFQAFCSAVASNGPAVLLLDEAPITVGPSSPSLIERDIETLALMIRDFCPDTIVILLARSAPRNPSIAAVELKALDEAETRTYLLAHPSANDEVRSQLGVSSVFRHTDGLPGKIDRALRTLRVVGLSELGPSVPTLIREEAGALETVPQSLINSVRELVTASDKVGERAFLLLKVLSILPHGESLARLKRIVPTSPLFPPHAEELLERGLIETRFAMAPLGENSDINGRVRLLIAPRQVRDYVLTLMAESEIDDLTRRAISIYFGEEWRVGKASMRKADGKLVDEDGSLMQNPHALVVGLLSSNATWLRKEIANPIVSLAQVYCAALISTKNYRICAIACKDILDAIPELGYEDVRQAVLILLARSTRMIGEHKKARGMFEALLSRGLPKKTEKLILNSYALCLQSLDDSEATKVAARIIDAFPGTGEALQAQAITLEMSDAHDKDVQLRKLEKEARLRKADTVANNLAITRASRGAGDADIDAALRETQLTSARMKDTYNATRAGLKLAQRSLADNGGLSADAVLNLVHAYQYFYGERFNGLFTEAHDALWRYFESKGDTLNLLSLYRHSSFIWRLYGNVSNERKYAKRLIKGFRNILTMDPLSADQDTAYFLIRARDDVLLPSPPTGVE